MSAYEQIDELKQASLTMSAVSSPNLRTPLHALDEERHFALVDGFAVPTLGSLVIVSGQELGPTHASLRSATPIMITSSDSLLEMSSDMNRDGSRSDSEPRTHDSSR